MEYQNHTDAPGKGLLKVSGILLIIFAAISIVILVFGMIAAATLGGALGAAVGGIVLVLGLVSTVFSLIMGILGVKYANVPAKATVCMVFAIIAIALQLINLISGDANVNIISTLIGLILPVLYLIGALKNKQAAA